VVEEPHDVHAESRWQHLAGEGCTFEGGYSGWRIGAGEMRGMRGVRFILPKQKEEQFWEEEDEEKESRFFVSEEIDVPFDGERVYLREQRFGVSEFAPRNFPTTTDDVPIGIPIHSTCYSIFSHISRQHLGHVDIDGLADLWHRKACGGCGFQGLHHDPVIRDLKEKFWVHRPGTEYLAANPVDIASFKMTMMGVYSEKPRGDGVFATRDSVGAGLGAVSMSRSKTNEMGKRVFRRHRNPTDPFSFLPPELKNKILARLSPSEINALRLSSRSFRQLPKQIFKSFIMEEMPWFWEIDEIRGAVERDYAESFMEEFGGLEDLEMLEGVVPREWLRFVRERLEGRVLDVNWLEVYKQLRVMERGCLGVRNRKRVWEVVEKVVGMIEGVRRGMEEVSDGLVVCPEGMREKEKGGNERDFSSCPGCEKVQIELEEDSEYGDSEEEDFEEDSCSNSSEEESSVGQTSVEECSEDVCSSGEDSE